MWIYIVIAILFVCAMGAVLSLGFALVIGLVLLFLIIIATQKAAKWIVIFWKTRIKKENLPENYSFSLPYWPKGACWLFILTNLAILIIIFVKGFDSLPFAGDTEYLVLASITLFSSVIYSISEDNCEIIGQTLITLIMLFCLIYYIAHAESMLGIYHW